MNIVRSKHILRGDYTQPKLNTFCARNEVLIMTKVSGFWGKCQSKNTTVPSQNIIDVYIHTSPLSWQDEMIRDEMKEQWSICFIYTSIFHFYRLLMFLHFILGIVWLKVITKYASHVFKKLDYTYCF